MLEKARELQEELEKKGRAFKEKHDEMIFFLIRFVAYIYCADMTIQFQFVPGSDIDLLSYLEVISYLVILAFIFLFPKLSDLQT